MSHPAKESVFLRHLPCGTCGSSDANSEYTDGHQYCHSCTTYVHGEGRSDAAPAAPLNRGLITVEYAAITARGLTEETCRKFRYGWGTYGGQQVQVAQYGDAEGTIVAQHIRTRDKDFPWIGAKKQAVLYGQHLWSKGGRMVVVTEGEIDALSVSQVQGNKWPVVSIISGAKGAKKDLTASLEWLESFETVVLMFDMDEPGQEAAQECAALFSPGKCKIATLPLKDANDMLQAKMTAELVSAIWSAREWRPDGIVTVDDVVARALVPPEQGLPWMFPTLTGLTFGRRYGELYGFGAGVGAGKTALFMQQIACDVDAGHKVGLFLLEQPAEETLVRVAGVRAGKAFNIPGEDWTQEEKEVAIRALSGTMVLYDSFGGTEWEVIKPKIRYMAIAHGIRIFYLDHLTALINPSNERESLDVIMKELAGLAHELRIVLHFVSHLSTPEGKGHEEGARVMEKQFTGSRSIARWAHFLFGLERNKQAEDPDERGTTLFRVLKDRFTGRASGCTFSYRYDPKTTRLHEVDGFTVEGQGDF